LARDVIYYRVKEMTFPRETFNNLLKNIHYQKKQERGQRAPLMKLSLDLNPRPRNSI
jgi:hypothetical protein